jgi:hypothetical protein
MRLSKWEKRRLPIDEKLHLRVKLGLLTWEEAEAEAVRTGAPIKYWANPERFDPSREVFWTLSMTAAWIIYRTQDRVREYWNEYRAASYYWRGHMTATPHINEGVGHSLCPLYAVTVADVFERAALLPEAIQNFEGLHPVQAQFELRRALMSGDLVAFGIPHKSENRVAIPSLDWIDLSLETAPLVDAESVGNGDGFEPGRYKSVCVRMEDVFRLWQPLLPEKSERATSSEGIARKVLVKFFEDLPSDQREEITKLDARTHLRSQNIEISARGFNMRVWPQAREIAGLAAVARSGRKKLKR